MALRPFSSNRLPPGNEASFIYDRVSRTEKPMAWNLTPGSMAIGRWLSEMCNVQNAHTCNNEWWSYGEENTPMIVSYIQLRYQLKVYLQALFEQIHHTYDAAVYGFRTDRSADREDDAGECQCYHAAVHVWLAAACHPVTIPNAPSGRCICRRRARVRQSRGRTGGQTRHMLVD
ncbi:hypothetical protein V6Z92_001927 [Aspergillus fumigatus]